MAQDTKSSPTKTSSTGSRNDELIKKLEQQISELRQTMGNRLDTELREITESISLLKDSHENGSLHGNSPGPHGQTKSTPKPAKRKAPKELVIKDTLVLDSPTHKNMTLNDPQGFEDRLMARVKDALKGIIDQ